MRKIKICLLALAVAVLFLVPLKTQAASQLTITKYENGIVTWTPLDDTSMLYYLVSVRAYKDDRFLGGPGKFVYTKYIKGQAYVSTDIRKEIAYAAKDYGDCNKIRIAIMPHRENVSVITNPEMVTYEFSIVYMKTLDVPKNFRIENKILKWDAVPDASGYVLSCALPSGKVESIEISQGLTSYDLNGFFAEKAQNKVFGRFGFGLAAEGNFQTTIRSKQASLNYDFSNAIINGVALENNGKQYSYGNGYVSFDVNTCTLTLCNATIKVQQIVLFTFWE